MQRSEKELVGLKNKDEKAIAENTVSYLDDAKNQDIIALRSYLDQLQSDTDITGIYEKEYILRKVCSIITNLKYNLDFELKEYLFNYFHEIFLDDVEAKSIGLNDEVLSRLMADEEFNKASDEETQKYLSHNFSISVFSKELDDLYGFCEKTASKLIRHDTSSITIMVERCLFCIENDEKPRGILFALELVNLEEVTPAITILMELAKKGRATEMSSFLHRMLPKVSGDEAVMMKILKLNIEHTHLDENIANDIVMKEYILRTYLNAVESFIEAKHAKYAAELLYELVNRGWFTGLKNLINTKFIDLTNKIISLNTALTQAICVMAKKLNVDVYTNNNIVSIGREVKVAPVTPRVISAPAKKEIKENIEVAPTPEPATENAPKEEVSNKDVDNTAENKTTEAVEGDVFQNILNEMATKDAHAEEDVDEDNDNDTYDYDDDDDEHSERRDIKINLQNILNITSKDIDRHFEKIKDITAKASERAEKIIEQVEQIDIANSKSVEKIKEVAKKVSDIKWKK